MKKVAIIGAGVSGLTVAQLLKNRYAVKVFEKERKPGGLIRCERVDGSLFHICGGHVFNTKDQRVLDWFWSHFDRERQFLKANRKSAVCMEDGRFVDYPIENHVYQMDEAVQKAFFADLDAMEHNQGPEPTNFDEFLRCRFGQTLYNLYFKPYNAKIWRRDLRDVPLSWLEGKLPMPTVKEMREANANHLEEKTFVHSSFYYEREGGSQLIADTLAAGVDVLYETPVREIVPQESGRCLVNGQPFDTVVYCGNVKELPAIMAGFDFGDYAQSIADLEYHGTTAVFCRFDQNPYSWFYQPSPRHHSHRFICTGNFSPSNNAPGVMTGTVEFTDAIDVDEIKAELGLMPYHPEYITHHYSPYTYPVQHKDTRSVIKGLKAKLSTVGVHLVGRFAEWEYFNMDAAMASAMRCCDGL